jgi:hypothetical protein
VDAASFDSTRSLVNNGIASLMRSVKLVAVRTTEAYPLIESLIGERCVEVFFSASCQCSQHGFGSFAPHQIVILRHGVSFTSISWCTSDCMEHLHNGLEHLQRSARQHMHSSWSIRALVPKPVCLSGSASGTFRISICLRVEVKFPWHHLCLNSQIL